MYGTESRLSKKPCTTNREKPAKTSRRSLQCIKESARLAIALQLKIEGFEIVVFNRAVEAGENSIIVDVFAEDCLGSRMAVYCISSAKEAEEGYLNDVACSILDEFGEDCLIAFAYPLRLIRFVGNAIGLANRIYLIDDEGRVWLHEPLRLYADAKFAWRPIEMTEKEVRLDERNLSKNLVERDFYVV